MHSYPAPVTEGCLISVSRRGAGSGGRGIPCIGDAVSWPGGPSREAPGASTLRRGALTAGTAGRLSEASGPSARSLNGQIAPCVKRPTPGDLRGANLETPRAGRLGSGGLAACPAGRRAPTRTSTSLDVARRRGPWVRAPCAPGPLASRAPSVLSRAGGQFDAGYRASPASGPPQHDGVPGAAKKQGGGAMPAGSQPPRYRRAGHTCVRLATLLEHLSHTPR